MPPPRAVRCHHHLLLLVIIGSSSAWGPQLARAPRHVHYRRRTLPLLGSSSSGESTSSSYDLVVLGAGPVGVTAALTAAELDKKVLLVDAPAFSGALMKEKEDLSLGGPTGLFSKALRDTSKRLSVATLRGMGVSEGSIWNEVRVVCEQLAAINARDRRRALSSAGVTYLQGLATLTKCPHDAAAGDAGGEGGGEEEDGGGEGEGGAAFYYRKFKAAEAAEKDACFEVTVRQEDGVSQSVEGEAVYARKVLIATGSTAFRPKSIPFEEYPDRIFDSDSINNLGFLPKSVAITGSGIIAIEFAKIFRRLGAEVTLIIRDKVKGEVGFALLIISLVGITGACSHPLVGSHGWVWKSVSIDERANELNERMNE